MEIIIGPMFSGKSTELIRRTTRLKSINKKVLLVNSILDSRCNMEIQTHDKKSLEANKTEFLRDIFELEDYNTCDVVAIDESQFFNDLYETIPKIISDNKHCIVCGLDGDANQNKFGQILDLIPFATKLDKLSGYCSICNDGTEGTFSIKKNKNQDSDSIIEIGANDIYMCVCIKHIDFNRTKEKSTNKNVNENENNKEDLIIKCTDWNNTDVLSQKLANFN